MSKRHNGIDFTVTNMPTVGLYKASTDDGLMCATATTEAEAVAKFKAGVDAIISIGGVLPALDADVQFVGKGGRVLTGRVVGRRACWSKRRNGRRILAGARVTIQVRVGLALVDHIVAPSDITA